MVVAMTLTMTMEQMIAMFASYDWSYGSYGGMTSILFWNTTTLI